MESINLLTADCRIASASDKVLNSECAYTFHTPYTSSKGILVSLNHWIGMAEELALLSTKKSSSNSDGSIFVRILKERNRRINGTEEHATVDDDSDKIPTKLGVGVEGGFQSEEDKYETISEYSILVLAEGKTKTELPYTEESKSDFPILVQQSADSVINHVGLTTQQDVQAWQLDQDEDVPISKYAESLPFVDNGIMIDPNPKSWVCQKTNESSDNLWLNLSDGFIGGGRKNWDGSGGTNGALDHYKEAGNKFPLVVKLGTISKDLSQTDCYSYAPDEDGPVKIPNLQQLLEKRGIQIANLQKTSKSTAELEVQLNATYAFDAITESGSKLVDVSGSGYQGLQNLGNSCYMNSILQLLFSGNITELANRYGSISCTSDTSEGKQVPNITEHVFLQQPELKPTQMPNDILCQTAKIGCALTSGIFAKPTNLKTSLNSEEKSNDDDNKNDTDPKYRLAPRMFKHIIAKDHIDFRTGQQQDTAHYLLHLLEVLDRAETKAFANSQNNDLTKRHLLGRDVASIDDAELHTTSHLFSYQTNSRLQCDIDNKVKYSTSAPEILLSLRIPMEKATLPQNGVDDGANGETAPEQKRHKSDDAMVTMPEGCIASKKNQDMVSEEEKKEDVPTVSFQDCIDAWGTETIVEGIRWSHLKGNHEETTSSAKQSIRFANFPRYLIVQLQRYKMGNDWVPVKLEVNIDISEQIDLSTFKFDGIKDDESLIPDDEQDNNNSNNNENGISIQSQTAIDEGSLSQLMDMGFSMYGCKRALTAVGGSDVEAAMNWVFEHNMDPDFNDPLPEQQQSNNSSGAATDGVDDAVVASLVASLGCFTADQVRAALKETNGAADRAADWLFSHMDDLDTAISNLNKSTNDDDREVKSPDIQLGDGAGKYNMIGMVSHIGKNTGSGHYVAHLKKKINGENKWVIFNDEKVAYSESPPIQHAYMYLFQRNDTINSPSPSY